nr:hypothetical protein [Candidatus Izemoplasmatales bacterium]
MFYHVSDDPNLKELIPRVPICACSIYENIYTHRVCFSTSITGCLSATDKISGIYYVYVPMHKIHGIKPTENEVTDAKYTGEIWYMKPIQIKLIGSIQVKNYTSSKSYH